MKPGALVRVFAEASMFLSKQTFSMRESSSQAGLKGSQVSKS